MVLEAVLDPAHADAELAAWRDRVSALTTAIGWRSTCSGHRYGDRAALAFTAPIDVLLTATLVNEWAWTGAATDGVRRAEAAADPTDERLPMEQAKAVERLRILLRDEANPALLALEARARRQGQPFLFDDEAVSIGYGARSRTWPARELPAPDAVPWDELGTVPVALVTGSNGKTTTVRLVAAMLTEAGHTVGYCCSDGVYIAGKQVERGDWSGPAGARQVLRDHRVNAAVLETARGGLLRRGLVVPRATAAIVTNIAEDHFGGYGITTLAELAATKLLVARALDDGDTLVLNADDPTLRATAHGHRGRVEWFSPGAADALVPAAAEMPITLGGTARHNVANAIGAAHLARALGVADAGIRATLLRFGAENSDNPGRLERFVVDGVRVWIDYAHNPHGLAELLAAARAQLGGGRLGLLLGQAGDREDDAIRALARTAWEARPARIVLKDLDGYLRGRAPGAIPALLEAELLAAGARADQLSFAGDETTGVRTLLEWATVGDLLVLPVHALEARDAAVEMVRNWT